MDILNEVKNIVAEVCEVEISKVNNDSSIGDFDAWDSIGHLTILSTVEEKFGIEFDPEEMMDLEDINDIVKAVEGSNYIRGRANNLCRTLGVY